jgi:hypothetical protein
MTGASGNTLFEDVSILYATYAELATNPLIYSAAHFLIATAVSIYVFPLQYSRETSKADFYGSIINMFSLEAKKKWQLTKVAVYSGFLTGILSSVLISLESNKISIITAVIYGILGPNFLLKYASKLLKMDLEKEIDKSFKDETSSIAETYKTWLSDIDKDIGQKADHPEHFAGTGR